MMTVRGYDSERKAIERVKAVFQRAFEILDRDSYKSRPSNWVFYDDGRYGAVSGFSRFDFGVSCGNNLVVLGEIKLKLVSLGRVIDFVFSTSKAHGISNVFICTPEVFTCINVHGAPTKPEFKELTPENVAKCLSEIVPESQVLDDTSKERLKGIINESELDGDRKAKLSDVVDKALLSSDDSQYFSMDDLSERTFFEVLLGDVTDDCLCRYTSLGSIFRTLNEGQQSMCCIVSMNDRSETDFASKETNYTNFTDIADLNSCFILSCSEVGMRDNLTMWRLYGDNARGVCLKYKVDRKVLGSNKNFVLARILYTDASGRCKELELVKNLLAKAKGRSLSLKYWKVWQHFFKPFEYSDEKEIRLLYWYNKDLDPMPHRFWILNGEFGIVTPIVTFDACDNSMVFPLKLEEVILGPRCSETKLNLSQIKLLSTEHGFTTDVTVSNIEHYR